MTWKMVSLYIFKMIWLLYITLLQIKIFLHFETAWRFILYLLLFILGQPDTDSERSALLSKMWRVAKKSPYKYFLQTLKEEITPDMVNSIKYRLKGNVISFFLFTISVWCNFSAHSPPHTLFKLVFFSRQQ